MKIFNEIGTFWIPKLGEQKFAGLIKIEKGNFYLNSKTEFLHFNEEYDDFLHNIESSNDKSIKDSFLILGMINQTPITLVILPFDFLGVPDTKFKISTIFKNVHLKDLNNIKFKEISLFINNINNFMPAMDIKSNHEEDKLNKSLEYNVKYKSLTVVEIDLIRFKLNFYPNFSCKNEFHDSRNVNINEKIEINLDYNIKVELNEIRRDIRHLEKFFTLVLGKSPIIGIEAKLKSGKSKDKIEIFTPEIVEDMKNNEKKNIFNALFKLDEIDNLSLLFKNWFNKYELLEPFYYLYFSTIFSNYYAETTFLLYTQTLEAYFRRMKNEKSEYYDKKSFKILEENMNYYIESCYENFLEFEINNDFKNKVKSSIKYSYQYSLRTILKELLYKLDFARINEILDNHSKKKNRELKIKEFINIVVDTRNYYTHYDNQNPPDIDLVLNLMKELKCIIEICFMEELGLSKAEIEKISENNNRFDVSHYKSYPSLI
jgi:hypothetical protein